MELRIDPEFKALIPPLSKEEREQLEKNLVADGCRDPLVVWDDSLLDGHNRYEICTRLNIPYTYVEKFFQDRVEATIWIINNQFGRRNLSDYERAKLALKLKPLIAGRARDNLVTHTTEGYQGLQNSAKAVIDTRQELAKAAGVSHDTIAKVEKIEAEGVDELKQAASGDRRISINAASQIATLPKEEQRLVVEMTPKQIVAKANEIKREQKKAKKQEKIIATEKAVEIIHQKAKVDISSVADIRQCTCRELFLSGIRPDAVITDPPYPKEFLHVFTELAEGCALAKVPLVAVMSGQSYLPEVMQRLVKCLQYRWTLAYFTPGGQAVQQWQAKTNTFWKPILLFGESEEWFGDVVTSKTNDNDKRFHSWGQSESGMADLVERLTKPGQLVCDPFLGGGTTAMVCLSLGRKFVGCDIEPKHIESSKERCREVVSNGC
jgi:transcriptional regulator with XRE-family HTH domain